MNEQPERFLFRLDPWSVLKAALVLVGLFVLYLLRDTVLVVLAALVIASAIEPATRWIMRYRIPRAPAVVFIYLCIALVLFSIVYFVLPSLLFDAAGFLTKIPTYTDTIQLPTFLTQFTTASSSGILGGVSRTLSARDVVSGARSLLEIPGGVFQFVSTIFGGVLSFVFIIVFSFYFAVQEQGIQNFLRIIVPHKHQSYAIDLWERSQRKIGQWMQGQLLLMLIVGLLVYLGLSILGVRHAFLFAILAGLLEIIPLFGPILSSIPAILVSFADGGVSVALIVAGLYIIIQQFENHLIYPLVVNKIVGVPAMIVILALIIGAELGGFLGALLSVPLAAALMEFVSDLKQKNSTGTQSDTA